MNYKTYSAPKSQEITLQQLFDFQPNIAPKKKEWNHE